MTLPTVVSTTTTTNDEKASQNNSWYALPALPDLPALPALPNVSNTMSEMTQKADISLRGFLTENVAYIQGKITTETPHTLALQKENAMVESLHIGVITLVVSLPLILAMVWAA